MIRWLASAIPVYPRRAVRVARLIRRVIWSSGSMKSSVVSIPIGAVAVLLILSIATTGVFASGSNSKWASEIVWGSGVQWQMIAPPGQGSAIPTEPLYVVAPQTSTPQSPADNNHLPGVAHDHVVAPPPRNSGAYNANWHVYVVLCTQSGISAGACIPDMVTFPGPGGPGTGPTLPLAISINGAALTSDAPIQSGVASGQAMLFDSGINFICLIVPLN